MIPQMAGPYGAGSNGEFVLVALGLACATAVVLTLIFAVTRPQMRRIELLREAIQNPSLDPKVREFVMAQLTRPNFVVRFWRGLWSSRTAVLVGWFGLFLGIGLVASGERDAEEAGGPLALAAFAILTAPFALREFERKQLPARD